ncbi:unnamed protein product [Leuciscus chuanchicus]
MSTAELRVHLKAATRHKKRPSCDASNSKLESQLRNNAQEALRAIGSNRTLKASYERAKQGQHVFNKGLLKFHCSVLEDLLKDVGGYHEQLKNLVQDLMIPLNQSVNDSISTMVANFGEFHHLEQGSPISVLEGRCPAEFGSNPN